MFYCDYVRQKLALICNIASRIRDISGTEMCKNNINNYAYVIDARFDKSTHDLLTMCLSVRMNG